MYSVFDDKGYMSLKFKTMQEVEKCAEEWRDTYMGEGVDYDSYISIVEWVNDHDFEEVKRWGIVVDEQQHKDYGNPRDQGCDYDFWAKWSVEEEV